MDFEIAVILVIKHSEKGVFKAFDKHFMYMALPLLIKLCTLATLFPK